jgi:UDP-N-acetylglucosamine--N-acetylmuramyl-(pentapeptide) pyrophosphoryl-undecaprenol N-acetylglucosamine transferase
MKRQERQAGNGVLIMAGGTGGHIFPGLAVADELKSRGIPVRWLGASGGMECQQVPASGIKIDVVQIGGVRGKGLLRWLVTPFRLLRAVAQAWEKLSAQQPSCALSFGGYAAGPGGLAAWLRGVPLVVHEQNRIPGLTNRILARMAGRVLQAFPGTFPEKRNAMTCGNPVRSDVAELPSPAERFAGRDGAIRILVTGGSQGSLALNRTVPRALALMDAECRPQVRHQAGKKWVEETRAAYHNAGVDAQISEFIDDMARAYAWADLVVCRSGALTVSELAAAGVGALLVPYPHAVDDHQSRNAEVLTDALAAVVQQEAGMTAESLSTQLSSLLGDRKELARMAVAARSVACPGAAHTVADVCGEWVTQ